MSKNKKIELELALMPDREFSRYMVEQVENSLPSGYIAIVQDELKSFGIDASADQISKVKRGTMYSRRIAYAINQVGLKLKLQK